MALGREKGEMLGQIEKLGPKESDLGFSKEIGRKMTRNHQMKSCDGNGIVAINSNDVVAAYPINDSVSFKEESGQTTSARLEEMGRLKKDPSQPAKEDEEEN